MSVMREIDPSLLSILPEEAELRAVREGGLVEAYLPTELIDTEEVPVDADHVTELRNSMESEARRSGRTGQLSAVLTAHVVEMRKLPIIDGFHRASAIKQAGGKEVYTTIRPNSTWEDVIDLRILTAHSHRTVRFARVVEWTEDAWSLSGWSDKLNAIQAFSLPKNTKQVGRNLGLESHEVDQVRSWVEDKCHQWKLSPSAVYNALYVAKVIDPQLIKNSRERRSAVRSGSLTPHHLRVLSTIMPHDYERQQLAARLIVNGELTVREATAMAGVLNRINDLDEAKKVAETGSWRNLIRPHIKKHPKDEGILIGEPHILDQSNPLSLHELQRTILFDEITIAKLSLQNLILSGRYKISAATDESSDFFPPVAGIEHHRMVWTEENTSKFLKDVQEVKPAYITYLKKGVDQTEAEQIFKEALNDIFTDIQQGALKFSLVENRHILNSLLNSAIRNRVAARNQEGTQNSSGSESEAMAVSDEAQGDVIVTAPVIEGLLPFLTPQERQILILGAAYRLSAAVIAQVVQISEVELEEKASELRDFLTGKKKPRETGRKYVKQESTEEDNALHSETTRLDLPITEAQIEYGLTNREMDVIRLISMGLKNSEISVALSISAETTKSHVKHCLTKMDVRSRYEMIAKAYETGILVKLDDSN